MDRPHAAAGPPDGRRPAPRRLLGARTDRRPPGAHREDRRPLHAWVFVDRTARASRPMPPTHAPAAAAGEAAWRLATARHPGRAEGPRADQGRPGDSRQQDPRGPHRPVRRPHRGAAARGRRGAAGQDQHGRVRHGLVDRVLGVGADGQPVGPRPRAWWLRGLGIGGRGVPRAAVDRHGHRRLDPPAGGAGRHRRAEADLRAGQPLRHRRLRLVARPDRAAWA